MIRSVKRWPCSTRNIKPHIYFFGGYWRVTHWNHVISTLGLWRDAHAFVARLNTDINVKTVRTRGLGGKS